ncbi:nuclear transport factor 2 family protein [Deltaproteobacteria bacterium]|nr:nuclear transport factor 2 family protein [Deltaproteobacteria bacterium]
MKTRAKPFLIFFACLIIALGAFGGCAQQEADNSQAIEAQRLAQRALDVHEVQNVFSKHCYYHENGLHRAEMEDIWVKKDGEFAKTAKWTQPMGMNEGYDAIWAFYVIGKEKTLKQNLEDISKVYPEIQNVPENLGIGGEWASHLQTTPIIEVAGDGKTAKGTWYSPGLRMSAQVRDGKVSKSGGWFWEKYAADLVKEDGEWKIWHIAMFYENGPPGWNADTQSYEVSSGPGGEGGRGGAPSGGAGDAPVVGKVAAELEPQTQSEQNYSTTNPNPYKAWSPTKLPEIEPRFPEPYYTFSETFSY